MNALEKAQLMEEAKASTALDGETQSIDPPEKGVDSVTIPEALQYAELELLHKLEGWLVMQKEWPLLFLKDRKARRRASQAIARKLYTMPSRSIMA